MRIIYRPLATFVLGLCLVANLVMIAGLGALGVDLLTMPANDIRNGGIVVIFLLWVYAIYTLFRFVMEIPLDFKDIWR